ncbi:MAG: hypothetical protein HYS27_10000 [Deltaproteobacteria bacterium]|nr:hypothetical protein [Deltaproteobacteria bacterium]
MLFRTSVLLAVAAAPVLFAVPARAQADAGVQDAGVEDAGTPDNPCDPSCDGDTLRFCDGETPRELPCDAPFARCDELSAAWGADCLLPEGAACDPGYAFGESRCDRAASLYCIEGTCQVASGPEVPGPLSPSPGTSSTSGTSATSDPFGCSSCGSASALGLLGCGGALRRLRRRARRT